MTGSLRSTARNPLAIALMGLLMLVFLLLGVGGGGRFPDVFRSGGGDAVVSAGAHSMSPQDFRRIFQSEKARFEQQSQQEAPVELLVQNGFDQQLLNAIAEDESEIEMLSRSGIAPAASLVDSEIRKMPIAFDRITGKFSEAQFTQALASQGLTPRQAQAEITDDLAQRHFGYALETGLRVPRIYAALTAIVGLENRDVTYFILDPKTVPQPPAPSDAQLLAFIKAHAAQLTRPEMRSISLVRFSAAAFAPTIVVDPAAVEKQFAFSKDSLSTPETRTIVQVPVKTAAQAAAAAARLTHGDDPAVIAKAFGAEPVTYTDKPQSAIADRKLAAAAFSMKAGQVTGPVQGDLGLAVLKVVKVTPGVAATLESARAKIEADLRTNAAKDRAYQLSQKFDDARQAGSSVIDAARKVGVTVATVGPVTAQGVGLDGKPNPLLTEKILKSAFSQTAGEDSDLEDAGSGEYFALHVDKVIPAAPPPLAEIRPQLAKAWVNEQFTNALRAKADGLMDQLRKGAAMETVAGSVGGRVVHQVGMQRIAAQQYQAMGRDFLQGVFTSKPGEVFAAPTPNGQVFVARLDAVRPGDLTTMGRAVETIRPRLSQDYASDLLESVKAAARSRVKATINLAAARQAIGVDPNVAARAKGGPRAK
ncbi:MAG TPA: peptidyl-prolyl cis-trans isomerase [Caulobacteraceae bacterium]